MFVVHGTKKFLDRVHEPLTWPDAVSTTALGGWYATVLFWKPQVALFVNETTLLPVFMPLAPTATVIDRFPATLGVVLQAHGINHRFVEPELEHMTEHRLAKTASRSVIGSMNEVAFMADIDRQHGRSEDLLTLSLQLAAMPCGPLHKRHISPDLELAALVAEQLG